MTALAPLVDNERLQQRFWSKVEKTEDCWLWTASLNEHGYGQFYMGRNPETGKRFLRKAHIVSWTIANGERTPGLVLDHLCRNRLCVNPEHLEEVTNRENIIRSPYMAPGARRRSYPLAIMCKSGRHALAESSVVRSDGTRLCGPCREEWWDNYLAKGRKA